MQTQEVEDYNWKFPSRTDTMYLSTIQKRNRPSTSHQKKTMDVSDIDGAQPKFLTRRPLII